ncbi:hypothetical protein DFJ74DRAFT_273443, partial [Hyaloraphidium curvatum]
PPSAQPLRDRRAESAPRHGQWAAAAAPALPPPRRRRTRHRLPRSPRPTFPPSRTAASPPPCGTGSMCGARCSPRPSRPRCSRGWGSCRRAGTAVRGRGTMRCASSATWSTAGRFQCRFSTTTRMRRRIRRTRRRRARRAARRARAGRAPPPACERGTARWRCWQTNPAGRRRGCSPAGGCGARGAAGIGGGGTGDASRGGSDGHGRGGLGRGRASGGLWMMRCREHYGRCAAAERFSDWSRGLRL